jgi:hypothetical protein
MNAAETHPKVRMIVLLPESLAGDPALSRCMYAFANREKAEVTYLVFLKDSEVILPVTRRMVTMKALTSNNELTVHFRLIVDDRKNKALQTFDEVTGQDSFTGRDSFIPKSLPMPCCAPFEMVLTPEVLDHQSLFEETTGSAHLMEEKAIIFTVKSHHFPRKRKEMQ